MNKEIGRNDPCPCGSGKKYKKCCGAKSGMAKHSASVMPSSADSLFGRISAVQKETRDRQEKVKPLSERLSTLGELPKTPPKDPQEKD